jgi:tRNA-binding EMAP/Myf-like protein
MMFDGTLIKEGELRGVKSEGMLCSSSELNFPPELQQEGIYILEDDAIVGEDVFKEKENNNE